MLSGCRLVAAVEHAAVVCSRAVARTVHPIRAAVVPLLLFGVSVSSCHAAWRSRFRCLAHFVRPFANRPIVQGSASVHRSPLHLAWFASSWTLVQGCAALFVGLAHWSLINAAPLPLPLRPPMLLKPFRRVAPPDIAPNTRAALQLPQGVFLRLVVKVRPIDKACFRGLCGSRRVGFQANRRRVACVTVRRYSPPTLRTGFAMEAPERCCALALLSIGFLRCAAVAAVK